MPTLVLKFKENVLARFQLRQGQSLNIGRRKTNDVVIDNLAVSGHHAKIDSVGEGFVFIDLKSKNGSFVNEQLVNSHWLGDGDIINIGKHSLLFSTNNDDRTIASGNKKMDKTMVMDTNQYRSMMKKSAAGIPKPIQRSGKIVGLLEYLAGGEGQIKLKTQLIRIGRASSADIIVRGWLIGRTAATISKHPDGFYLSHVAGLIRPRLNDQVVKKSARLSDRMSSPSGPPGGSFSLKKRASDEDCLSSLPSQNRRCDNRSAAAN